VSIKPTRCTTILENDLKLMNQNHLKLNIENDSNDKDKNENQDIQNESILGTDLTSGSNPDTGLLLSALDPRISSLGQRYLYKINDTENTSIDTQLYDYKYLRLLYGINEGLEIVDKIPLECNLDLLNYIDFAKGCYVGQVYIYIYIYIYTYAYICIYMFMHLFIFIYVFLYTYTNTCLFTYP
jgi:folate-binding protein YgfZ